MADERGNGGGGEARAERIDADVHDALPVPGSLLRSGLDGLAFMLYVIVAVWVGNALGAAGRAGFDALNYHVPTIARFADQLPKPDLSDYLSATTPGYHLIMALLGLVTPTNVGAAVIGVVLAQMAATGLYGRVWHIRSWLVARGEARSKESSIGVTWLCGLCITAPLLTSVYVFTSSAWSLPDNLAWAGVAFALVTSMHFRHSLLVYVFAALSLILLVFVRQIHLWAAAPIVIAAWMSAGIQSGLPVRLVETSDAGWSWRDLLFTQLDRRMKRVGLAVLCLLPAFALVGYFVHVWGGLTPPTFQGQYPVDMSKPALLRLVNAPAALAFVLALFGVFGSFFAAWWGPAAIRGLKHSRGRMVLGAGAVVGLLAAVIPATTYSMEQGRWSGLWNIAAKLPTVGHTSVLIAGLSMLGGVIVAAMMLGMRVSQAAVLATSVAGFAAAQMASFQLWQRYNEPFVLLVLIVCAGPLLASRDVTEPARPLSAAWWWRLRIAGPLVLAVLLGAVTVNELRKAEPQKDLKLQPGTERTKEFLRTGKIDSVPTSAP
jgi:hypothetical protein